MIWSSHLSVVVATSCLCTVSVLTQAQEAPSAASGAAIETIIVTANKHAEKLQEVPASVSALCGADLPESRISANDPSFTQSGPIALYGEEAVRGNAVFEAVPLFNVQRVEVLKGPQATLHGRNASGGGAASIVNTPAGFGTEGYVTLGYGNFNRREAKGSIQTSLIDQVLAPRFAFTQQIDRLGSPANINAE